MRRHDRRAFARAARDRHVARARGLDAPLQPRRRNNGRRYRPRCWMCCRRSSSGLARAGWLPPVNVDRACYDRFMTGRTWRFTVHDARGRAQDGVVVYASRVADMPPLARTMRFASCCSNSPAASRRHAERTAICVPAALRVRPVGGLPALHLPDAIESLTLPPYRMTAFAQADDDHGLARRRDGRRRLSGA